MVVECVIHVIFNMTCCFSCRMELTGEEAESMEELTETLAEQQQQQPGGGGSSSNSNSSSQLPDYIPLHMDKRHAGTSSQGLREEARRGNEVGNGQHQQEEEQEQEDKDWEAQLAKRAGLRPLPASMTSSSSTRGTSQSVSEQHDYRRDSQSTPPPSSSRAETEKLLSMLSYETVKRTLRSQITSLSSRSELADSRLRSLESSLENHRSEADALREVADAKQAQMAFLQVSSTRVCCDQYDQYHSCGCDGRLVCGCQFNVIR